MKKNELTEVIKFKKKLKLKETVGTRILISGEKFPENKQRLDKLLERVNSGREIPTAHYHDLLNYVLDTFSYSDTQQLINRTEDNRMYVRLLWEDEVSSGKSNLPFMDWVYDRVEFSLGSYA